jgi:hypothetical protein
MESLILRILLTIAGIISIIAESYNETIDIDDSRIHISADIYLICIMTGLWFI